MHRDIQLASTNQTCTLLCVVCKRRPRYSKDGKEFPTCGLNCAEILESGNGPQGMCCVCGVRPKYSDGSKMYRTCNKVMCRSKDKSTLARLCDYCHQRPKFHDGKNIFPQCGRECRDKAKRDKAIRSSSRPSASLKTNSPCLLCWNDAMIPGSDLCRSCKAKNTARENGLLLEAPRGHATFNNVATQFAIAWSGRRCPEVHEVYKVVEPLATTAIFESYRDTINGNRKEHRRWHGTTRQCDGFNPAHPDPCLSKSCSLCLAIRTSFNHEKFASGILTSSASSQSDLYADSSRDRKSAILVDVIIGKETESEEIPHCEVPGYDAVRLVARDTNGKRIEYDELLSYRHQAVKPLYIVVYGSS